MEKAIILRIQNILVAWILPQMDDILGFHCNRYRWMCSYFYMSLIVVLFWEIHNDRHYGRVVKATDLKSVGLCPRWFKSCWCRYFFIFIFFFIAYWLSDIFDSLTQIGDHAPIIISSGHAPISHGSQNNLRDVIHQDRGVSFSVGSAYIRMRRLLSRGKEKEKARITRHKSHSLCTDTGNRAEPGIRGRANFRGTSVCSGQVPWEQAAGG